MQTDPKHAPFRDVPFPETDIREYLAADGALLLRAAMSLGAYPERMTEGLLHWAAAAPDRVFMAQRDATGGWRKYTYGQTLEAVKSIAQALLNRGLTPETPVAILSENSIEHGLLAFAALHAGIPHAPVSPAYSLRSTDFVKLRQCIELLTPGLIFVADGKKYESALRAVAGKTEILVVANFPENLPATPFENLLKTVPGPAVEQAYHNIRPDTIAKILFTSGSTGPPKGVINTHGNICANWQQIRQTIPFLADDLLLLDWLPWSHTFGGNHNFGLCSWLGGSFYIDEGNPTPAGIAATVANLRDIAPTIYFNVPRGFEELIPRLKADQALRTMFFSRLKLLFYAGASISQPVWDALEALSVEATGQRVVISAGLGCTESSPAALLCAQKGGFAGLLGTPVPGLELKLAPAGDKLEARFRGPNITPGYWRQPELTARAFDAEGFYCTGDALRFAAPGNPNAGLLFDGRITEDFKISTGTWVHVGALRAQLIAAGAGLIQDVVLAGESRPFVGAIVFPDIHQLRKITGLDTAADITTLTTHPAARAALQQVLNDFAQRSTGSSSLVQRAVFADFTLSIDAGEITDKGSINQGAVLASRAATVERIYAEREDDGVVVVLERE
jgi:feruloyl-CoA synthase